MTLFDGQPLTDREVELASICECDHRYGAHRGGANCTRCGCVKFAGRAHAIGPSGLGTKRTDFEWGPLFMFHPDDALVPEDVCAICLQPLERGDIIRAVPPASKMLTHHAHEDCRLDLAAECM